MLPSRLALPACASLVVWFACAGPAAAQCPTWSNEFVMPGTDKRPYCALAHDDGSGPALFLGGEFRKVGGEGAASIARWDGERWSPLGTGMPGFGDYVLAMCSYDDGNGPALYAAGFFASAGGVPCSNPVSYTHLTLPTNSRV